MHTVWQRSSSSTTEGLSHWDIYDIMTYESIDDLLLANPVPARTLAVVGICTAEKDLVLEQEILDHERTNSQPDPPTTLDR